MKKTLISALFTGAMIIDTGFCSNFNKIQEKAVTILCTKMLMKGPT